MKILRINKLTIKIIFVVFIFIVFQKTTYAQPSLPQRSLTVEATQSLHFGSFCVTGSGGGTVTVGYDGSRTSTGDIALLAISPISTPAIFEVKLCEGRNVIITFNTTATLTGSSGSLTLDIGPTEKGVSGSNFLTNSNCDYINQIRVGGTLTVPGTTTSGIYSGSFNITFNNE